MTQVLTSQMLFFALDETDPEVPHLRLHLGRRDVEDLHEIMAFNFTHNPHLDALEYVFHARLLARVLNDPAQTHGILTYGECVQCMGYVWWKICNRGTGDPRDETLLEIFLHCLTLEAWIRVIRANYTELPLKIYRKAMPSLAAYETQHSLSEEQ